MRNLKPSPRLRSSVRLPREIDEALRLTSGNSCPQSDSASSSAAGAPHDAGGRAPDLSDFRHRKIIGTERRTIEPVARIIEYLENLIDDAESHAAGMGSILDYRMRIRCQTAEEILRYVRSLVTRQTETATDACPRCAGFRGFDSPKIL
jgi:hypothetical protein